MKSVSAFALVCMSSFAFNPAARADEAQQYGYSCEQVRAFVASTGKVKALAMAIEHGATWAQISAAKNCLKTKVRRLAQS